MDYFITIKLGAAKAVYLLLQGIRLDKILILSFIRKSAREVVERIKLFQDTGYALNLSRHFIQRMN